MMRLNILLLLVAFCGDSVYPEENTHHHDPLNPDMLQCPNRTFEGKDGDRVILPCSTQDKTDISHEEVEWTFKDPTTGKDKVVHTYFQGEDFLYKQSDDFKDRTFLFKEELSSGDCSLRLLVTTSHDGTYRCFVAGHLPCTVTLKVLPAREDDTSKMHQDVTESPDNPLSGGGVVAGAVIGGLVVVAPSTIILVVYFCSKRLKHRVSYWAQQQPEDEENKPADQNPNEERSQMIENEDQGDPAAGN